MTTVSLDTVVFVLRNTFLHIKLISIPQVFLFVSKSTRNAYVAFCNLNLQPYGFIMMA